MGSIGFRLTEIISHVNVLRNRYNWSGGERRPPFGGLHYVRAACGCSAPFVKGAAMNCISRAQGGAAHLAPVRHTIRGNMEARKSIAAQTLGRANFFLVREYLRKLTAVVNEAEMCFLT